MRRRDFIMFAGGAVAAWPLAARAQQPAMPVVGFLSLIVIDPHPNAAFRQGLAEAGYVEGKSVTIEDRFANFKQELLTQYASDLVRHNVSVIVLQPSPRRLPWSGTRRPASLSSG